MYMYMYMCIHVYIRPCVHVLYKTMYVLHVLLYMFIRFRIHDMYLCGISALLGATWIYMYILLAAVYMLFCMYMFVFVQDGSSHACVRAHHGLVFSEERQGRALITPKHSFFSSIFLYKL